MAQAKPTWAGRGPDVAPGKGEHTPWGHSASARQWWQSHWAGQRQQNANPSIHIHGAHIPHPAFHRHCQAGKGCQAHPVQLQSQGCCSSSCSRAELVFGTVRGCTLCVRASSPGRECPAQHKGWGRKALAEQHPAHWTCLTLPPGQTTTSPECSCPWEQLNSCSAPFNCLRKAAWNGFIVYCRHYIFRVVIFPLWRASHWSICRLCCLPPCALTISSCCMRGLLLNCFHAQSLSLQCLYVLHTHLTNF